MLRSFRRAARMISKAGSVSLPCSWMRVPRIFSQEGSMGRSRGHSTLQTSQVVQARKRVTQSGVKSARPAMYSRRKYHLARGDCDSQPRP